MAKILVVGGSLGGLFAANILHRQGHEIVLLEKSMNPMDGRGAGIVTHRPLFESLKQAGVSVDDTLGVLVTNRVVLGLNGETLSELPMTQILTSWSRLYLLLKSCLPVDLYLQGKAVKQVSQDSTQVEVHCEDGSHYSADLLIASDGLRSAVRHTVAPDIKPEYAGYVAWRGVCHESLLSKSTLDTLFNYFGFCLPEGEQMLGYPVAGFDYDTRVGKRCYNFVWYRPVSATELTDYLTDLSGTHYAHGIPPSKIKPTHIARMREASKMVLAPQYAEIIEKTDHPFVQAIYDVNSSEIVFNRIALMGDAGFVARPHVGMGVTKAGDDALSLAKHIQNFGATPQALTAYRDDRLQAGQAIVARAQYLGHYMQSQVRKEKSNNEAQFRSADIVMKETAIDLSSQVTAH